MAMTQTEKVLEYMKKYGAITSWEAYTDLGITQLGARIWELEKKAGYLIKHTPKTVKNSHGEEIRIISYSLTENDPLKRIN